MRNLTLLTSYYKNFYDDKKEKKILILICTMDIHVYKYKTIVVIYCSFYLRKIFNVEVSWKKILLLFSVFLHHMKGKIWFMKKQRNRKSGGSDKNEQWVNKNLFNNINYISS